MVQRGHGAVVWAERTRRVICAVVSSTEHVSRRSRVVSGTKRARTVVAGVEMKEEVMAVAKALGIHLGPEEAVLYRKYLLEQLAVLDTFV
jgi:hypothetical protein